MKLVIVMGHPPQNLLQQDAEERRVTAVPVRMATLGRALISARALVMVSATLHRDMPVRASDLERGKDRDTRTSGWCTLMEITCPGL